MKNNLIKTAVLVSGGGTNLQALIDACKNGVIKSCEISLVISSNPDAYALKRAFDAKIPALSIPNADIMDTEKEIIETLEKHNIELIVLAGFMTILSKNFTKKYKDRIINVHPSLIPSFCGKGF